MDKAKANAIVVVTKKALKGTKIDAKHAVSVKVEPMSETDQLESRAPSEALTPSHHAAKTSETKPENASRDGSSEPTAKEAVEEGTSQRVSGGSIAKPKGQRGYTTTSLEEYTARKKAIDAANAIPVADGEKRASRSQTAKPNATE